ncbi:MAG: hypothetical protein ACI83B_002733 [Sediminicola sp.]|jgi:hypothetical protein
MIAEELVEAVELVDSPLIINKKKINNETYSFEILGKKNNWNIELLFPESFPYRLPIAKLLDKKYIGIVPHVNQCGTICIEESDSVLLDYERPSDIISTYLQDAITLLERVKLKIYQDELFDEYEGYFDLTKKVNSFYFAEDKLEHVSLKLLYKENNRQQKHAVPTLLYDKNHPLPAKFSNLDKTTDLQIVNIIHLPLNNPMLPPSKGSDITPEYIDSIRGHITKNNDKKLKKLLKKEKNKNQFFILLSLPRTSTERSQLLLHYTSNQSLPHPLLYLSAEWKITSYLIKRHNKEYLLERGGADESLIDKKVTIIGCGSVGSEIAFTLAKAGVGELTLIDKDGLDADNIYRHNLGGYYLNFFPDSKTGIVKGNYKVNAITSKLRGELPFIKLNPKTVNFLEINTDKDLLKSDVLIVAVGSPTVSLLINRKLKELGLNKVIFCWNEAASYGGHSLSLDLDSSCLECIYTSNSGFTMESPISLLKLGQNISSNLTGCAGVFTPFSYLDSSQTAALATKQCIDILMHNIHSKALSWKGDGNKNLDVTNRYTNMPLKEEIHLNQHLKCRICNG